MTELMFFASKQQAIGWSLVTTGLILATSLWYFFPQGRTNKRPSRLADLRSFTLKEVLKDEVSLASCMHACDQQRNCVG